MQQTILVERLRSGRFISDWIGHFHNFEKIAFEVFLLYSISPHKRTHIVQLNHNLKNWNKIDLDLCFYLFVYFRAYA